MSAVLVIARALVDAGIATEEQAEAFRKSVAEQERRAWAEWYRIEKERRESLLKWKKMLPGQ